MMAAAAVEGPVTSDVNPAQADIAKAADKA